MWRSPTRLSPTRRTLMPPDEQFKPTDYPELFNNVPELTAFSG
jgi:hypothetical protein